MATDDSKSMTIDDDDSDDNGGIYIFIVVMRFAELLINIFIYINILISRSLFNRSVKKINRGSGVIVSGVIGDIMPFPE